MKWDPVFLVGVARIDEQHQELFRRLDALHEAMRSGGEGETMFMLDFVEKYVVEHFGEEEREMAGSQYPLFPGHQKMHQEFLANFEKLKASYQADGSLPVLGLNLHNLVSAWLRSHILGPDQAFGRYLTSLRSTGSS